MTRNRTRMAVVAAVGAGGLLASMTGVAPASAGHASGLAQQVSATIQTPAVTPFSLCITPPGQAKTCSPGTLPTNQSIVMVLDYIVGSASHLPDITTAVKAGPNVCTVYDGNGQPVRQGTQFAYAGAGNGNFRGDSGGTLTVNDEVIHTVEPSGEKPGPGELVLEFCQ